MNTDETASPPSFVTTVVVFVPVLVKVPLAPAAGAVKVILTPLTGVP